MAKRNIRNLLETTKELLKDEPGILIYKERKNLKCL
jgi:hypothetical protein